MSDLVITVAHCSAVPKNTVRRLHVCHNIPGNERALEMTSLLDTLDVLEKVVMDGVHDDTRVMAARREYGS